MESSFGRAESDVYRMEEEPSGVFSSDDSGGPADASAEDWGNDSSGTGLGVPPAGGGPSRPSPAGTEAGAAGDRRVTFGGTLPGSSDAAPPRAPPGGYHHQGAPTPGRESGRESGPDPGNGMNFRRVGAYSPFPSQSLRARPGEEYTQFGGDPFLSDAETPHASNRRGVAAGPFQPSRPDETPAFIRRAAADDRAGSVPPSSLARPRRPRDGPEAAAAATEVETALRDLQDSSFLGADASPLDGTFVSIRDLDGDDDVTSVDRWAGSPDRGDGPFPTESTSLLGGEDRGGKRMSWQGGFFGSRLEREDKRERKRIARARRRGIASGWLRAVRAALAGGEIGGRGGGGGAAHPSGSDFDHDGRGRHGGRAADRPRRGAFSRTLSAVLCLHLGLCGLHDLFLIYVSYRTDDGDGTEVQVSWNGEGPYVPAHWLSSDGLVANPFVGPGARTLTAFGAHVPGLVLGGQWWRLLTSLLGSSSLYDLVLQILALWGAVPGLERSRGTPTVLSLYVLCGAVGAVWSTVLDPGRLAATSGMGVAGLLAASIVEQRCRPPAAKDEDDGGGIGAASGSAGGAANGVASSSDEQFSFQPAAPKKKRRRPSLNEGSPALLLIAYASQLAVCLSALVGCALGLILFVGNPPPLPPAPPGRDLVLEEEGAEAPPPPPPRWADDDDSDSDGPRAFDTPLMRRSILTDDDDDEPLGTRSTLRKRRGETRDSAQARSPPPSPASRERRGGRPGRPFSASRAVARLVGTLLVVLLTLIPLSLVATGDGPSSSTTNAAVLGCTPMRILYAPDDGGGSVECAGSCVPLSLARAARGQEGMRPGRCDEVGYRCWQESGTLTLRGYDAGVGIYVYPSADGSCSEEEAVYGGNDDVQGEGQ